MYALVCVKTPSELSYCNSLGSEVRVEFSQLSDLFKYYEPRGLMRVSSIGHNK